MRTQIANTAKRFWPTFLLLLAASICVTGCAGFRHQHSDPLAEWNFSSLNNLDDNKVVSDDYHSYINQLPSKEKKGVSSIHYFENETSQHAVSIEVDVRGIFDGTEWRHILIYDSHDKRIKVIKYVMGHYSLW